jgi:hypothetical protein
MGRSEHYRALAHECLEMARTARDPCARATLKHMAEVWIRLAERHLADVKQNPVVTEPFRSRLFRPVFSKPQPCLSGHALPVCLSLFR